MKAKTVEELVQSQLTTCLAATEDCLTQSRIVRNDDKYGEIRRCDLEYVAKLVKASARLTEALSRLRGEKTQTIRVTRDKE